MAMPDSTRKRKGEIYRGSKGGGLGGAEGSTVNVQSVTEKKQLEKKNLKGGAGG